jgi:hypothetical protein
MCSIQYIGLDLHRDTISAAIPDSDGTVVMQSVLVTRAPVIRAKTTARVWQQE